LAIELGVGDGCGGGEGGSEPSLPSPLDDEDGGGDWAEEPDGLSSSGLSSFRGLVLESAASFSGSDRAAAEGLLPGQRGE